MGTHKEYRTHANAQQCKGTRSSAHRSAGTRERLRESMRARRNEGEHTGKQRKHGTQNYEGTHRTLRNTWEHKYLRNGREGTKPIEMRENARKEQKRAQTRGT